MQTIYESSFLILIYKPTFSQLEIIWLPESKNMSVEQYKSEFLTYIRFHNEYKIKLLLADETHLFFEVVPELQKWVSDMLNERVHKQAEKLAVIFSEDYLQKLAAEQMMTQSELQHIKTLFFESKDDAQKWLVTGRLKHVKQKVLFFYNNEFSTFSDLDHKNTDSTN
ncbi:hypothetical protein [Chondrinema litorale]|uniref:hypothetical protein n=1 Tax=Chondrinema litorale TaxID=2994555 RepID=UPI002542FD6A|nr:hypothetical protein [Chondrinema litorale]UZR97772.1 hypothetical protein OQ292_27580 [Chondrinema litorale]